MGSAKRDPSGKFIATKPVLDYVVSLPAGKSSAQEIIAALCEQLTKVSKVTVVAGTMALNMMVQTEVDLGTATSLPARAVLMQVSVATKYSVIWTLLWDPNEEMYVLNVMPAVHSYVSADGERRVQPVKLD